MSRRNKKNNQQTAKKNKILLASAQIKHGRDTDVLNEDIVNEIILDKNGRSAELVNREWILMFDQHQRFLKNLIALVQNSSTLGSILKNITSFTLGEGFKVVEAEAIPILQAIKKLIRTFAGENQKIKDLNNDFQAVNANGETLEEVAYKIVFDYVAFGNAFVEFVKTTKDAQPVVYMYHVPVHKCGLSKPNERGVSEFVAISPDWQNQNKKEYLTVLPKYPDFTTGAVKRSIIHIQQYAAGFEFFGLPEWVTARVDAENEYRIAKYNNGKLKNGFTPSAFAQFFGAMTEEEAEDLIEGIKETFTDTGNNSKIFAQVLRDESYKMNLEILEDKSEGRFLNLQQITTQKIITALRWTTSLSGIATAGKLGSNQQIRDEIEFVTNVVINPIRRVFLQRVANPYMKELSEAKNNKYKGLQLDIVNLKPVSLASSLDPQKSLLLNEQREELGFDKLSEEEEAKLATEQQL